MAYPGAYPDIRRGLRPVTQWTNWEFAWVLFLLQLVALIPLRSHLEGLEWEVAITYIMIPMGFAVYSRHTQEQVRGIAVKDILLYGVMAFWVTVCGAYLLFTQVFDMGLGTTLRSEVMGIVATQILFVAPCEELAFRFVIPNWLTKKLGKGRKWTVAIISSALFALFHYSAYSGDWSSMLIAFIIAMIWSLAYWRWGLGVTIGSHAGYNLLVSGILTGGIV